MRVSVLRVFSPAAENNFLFHRQPKAAQPFPRRKMALFAFVCLLWLCFGIFARDPWKPAETKLIAVIAEMAENGMRWTPLLPTESYIDYPPLYLWLTTLTARLFSDILPLHEGARIANIVLLATALWLTGMAARLFYGSRIGWLAALLAVGAAGFMIRGHLLNFGVPAFFGMAVALYGVAILTGDKKRQFKTLSAAAVVAAAVIFLLLAVGAIPAVAVAFVTFAAFARARNVTAIGVAIVLIVPLLFVWAAVNEAAAIALWQPVTDKWGGISATAVGADLAGMTRIAAWALFPLLPLALAGLYYERERHHPLFGYAWLAVVAGGIVFLLIGNDEEDYFLLLPPLAILAARALQSLPEDAARVLDFFALLVVGLCFVGGLWLVWFALVTGNPPQLADYLVTQFPGFTLPPVGWFAVGAAVALTVGWAVLASNFGHSNERAAVNWCTGVTLIWVIFNLLLAGYVDSGKSYRYLAADIAAQLDNDCLRPDVDSHMRAQLFYFGVPLGGDDCRYRLSATKMADTVWRGSRHPGDTSYYLSNHH